VGGFAEYEQYDALGLAELVAGGEVSALELLEEAIVRTETHNPLLNAIVTRFFDQAREVARGLDPASGPLAGVPFLIKDLNYVKGIPCSSGSRLFADVIPDHDAEIVERYRQAGLVLFGKTNTPEIGLDASTESRHLGPCRNPWNTTHSTGGSSGGAGAAVAAGIVPAAHATDGGGSIRIPASCCGLVGLKPSRGRTPLGPDVGEGWGGMSVGHVVSRTVRDSAAFLDATHGPAVGDPYHAPRFEGKFLDECKRDPGRLKIAVDLDPMTGAELDPACRTAVENTIKLCEQLGHQVVTAFPDFDREEFRSSTPVLVAANVANLVYSRAAALGRELSVEDVEPVTLSTAIRGRKTSAESYAKAVQFLHQTTRKVAAFFEEYDLILSPTLVQPPVPLGWLDTKSDNIDTYHDRFVKFWGFTNLYNATGQPAISLPLHWTDDDLPVGVQFAASYGNESLLLRIASQMEMAKPWFDKRPNL
jgi:amidase